MSAGAIQCSRVKSASGLMGWLYRRMIESKVGIVVADMPPSAAAAPPKTAGISIRSTLRRKEPPNPERCRACSPRSSWLVGARAAFGSKARKSHRP
jgi:hypothetical protein